MIQITPQMRIVVAVKAVDFRRGIDGLGRLCTEVLKADPFSGWLFVFRSRSGKSIKILVYDGQGFWLCQKRLSTRRFRFWPSSETQASRTVQAHELQMLLVGGNAERAEVALPWRRVSLGG